VEEEYMCGERGEMSGGGIYMCGERGDMSGGERNEWRRWIYEWRTKRLEWTKKRYQERT
jgi:hypothetical protein